MSGGVLNCNGCKSLRDMPVPYPSKTYLSIEVFWPMAGFHQILEMFARRSLASPEPIESAEYGLVGRNQKLRHRHM